MDNKTTNQPIKIKMSALLDGQRYLMQGGQQVLFVPFNEALRALANDPVQEFKTKYRAGRTLDQCERLLKDFAKTRDALIEQHGVKQSVVFGRRKAELEAMIDPAGPGVTIKAVDPIANELKQLTQHLEAIAKNPALDAYTIDPQDVEANAAFRKDMDEAAASEIELTHLAGPLKLVESKTVKGEEVACALTGEQLALLADLIEPPQ